MYESFQNNYRDKYQKETVKKVTDPVANFLCCDYFYISLTICETLQYYNEDNS